MQICKFFASRAQELTNDVSFVIFGQKTWDLGGGSNWPPWFSSTPAGIGLRNWNKITFKMVNFYQHPNWNYQVSITDLKNLILMLRSDINERDKAGGNKPLHFFLPGSIFIVVLKQQWATTVQSSMPQNLSLSTVITFFKDK